MGCVSSSLFNQDDDFTQIGGSAAFRHHIVSLTSTTYGLLTLDPPPSDELSPPPTTTIPPTPPPRFTLGSLFPSPLSSDLIRPLKPEIINSWELMAGLHDSSSTPPTAHHSFRFSPLPSTTKPAKENSNPNLLPFYNSKIIPFDDDVVAAPKHTQKNCTLLSDDSSDYSLDGFEKLCPPNGDNKVVIYTTTLRGIRKTFEACNTVRSAVEGLGFVICERDISMDKGFRDELRELMKGKDNSQLIPPRVFVKGRYIGGVEEVTRIAEDGCLGNLLQGLPKLRAGHVCEGCGGVKFLPCFQCNGSCKMVTLVEEEIGQQRTLVVRCSDCNENGLVLCPICS